MSHCKDAGEPTNIVAWNLEGDVVRVLYTPENERLERQTHLFWKKMKRNIIFQTSMITPPKINIEPENDGLVQMIFLSSGLFSGSSR